MFSFPYFQFFLLLTNSYSRLDPLYVDDITKPEVTLNVDGEQMIQITINALFISKFSA